MLAGFASFISTSSDLVAKSGLPMQLLLQDSTFPQRNPTLHHWSENPASPHAHPSTLVLEEAISQLVRQGPGFALRSRAASGSNRRFQAGKWRNDPRCAIGYRSLGTLNPADPTLCCFPQPLAGDRLRWQPAIVWPTLNLPSPKQAKTHAMLTH